MSPLLIAHRCGPGVCPEQSMAAARHALSLGADMVEMDVRFTRDGAPVICHDANALRVFGVDRLCSDMTLREFTALRHTADAACPAHTLADVLGSGIRPLLLHCKISGEPLRDIARRVAAHGAEGACVLGVQEVADVDIVRAACPAIRVLAFMPGLDCFERFLEGGAAIVRLWEDWVTEGRIDAAHVSHRCPSHAAPHSSQAGGKSRSSTRLPASETRFTARRDPKDRAAGRRPAASCRARRAPGRRPSRATA